MDSIKSHLTNSDDKLDNLILEYSYTTKNDTKRYNLYNQNVKLPLHKIWLLTPKLKIIRKSSILKNNDHEYCLITLALNDHDPQIKKFHELIKNIESYLSEKINSDELLTMRSCLKEDENSINTITFSIPIKNQIGIYDTTHKQTSLEQINHNDYLIMYLELNTVWENTEKYGMNWQILQMKVYPEFNFNACLFDDPIISSDDTHKSIPKPPQLSIPPSPSIHNNKQLPTPKNHHDAEKHGSFIPSVEQLLNIKNILKPVAPPTPPPPPKIQNTTKPVNKTGNNIVKKKKKINSTNSKQTIVNKLKN
ncbi:hypothetical protein Klosneuvirus_3_258 [Klosneuvirus KNV1]|uniref:Uncharacterized protein n=1 Tax=Klosneuvirus KNV1 TaxID=1977640 RepID=A0A1V0SK87_9VIRU|nr:hypothetical protein Klosneuvirus_3_258 [Klosneuvirus KNV1]